eukprot:scpid46468/ scgid14924/ Lathosterol oxidase; C-5 sterol desaturase; Delta(7)-sterol 5-desaturase; Lathosterol 5-desaturase; Sterol-C5-desaturase
MVVAMASYATLALQVAALFGVVYAWFYSGVPGVWRQVSSGEDSDELLSRLRLRAAASASSSAPGGGGGGGQLENLKEFATIAAVTHTCVFLLGFALSALGVNVANGLGAATATNPRRSLAVRFLRRSATCWTAFFACVAAGFVALHSFFRWSFEERVGITYRLAAQFFYERDGSTPFAVMSTTSYITFFAAGFAIKQLFPPSSPPQGSHVTADSQGASGNGNGGGGGVEGIVPPVFIRWTPWLAKAFLVAMVVFHCAVMPLYDRMVKPVIKTSPVPLDTETGTQGQEQAEAMLLSSPVLPEGEDFTHDFALLASLSHTAALAFGLLLCWLARLSMCHISAAAQPRQRQRRSLAEAATAVIPVAVVIVGGTLLLVALVRGVSGSSGAEVLFMANALSQWLVTQVIAVLESHAEVTSQLADVLGMSDNSAGGAELAHPLVLLSLTLWCVIGMATEYFNNSSNAGDSSREYIGTTSSGKKAKTSTVGSAQVTTVRPVFTLGPLAVYPVTKAQSDVVAWLLPLGFTLAGLASDHPALFYDSLIRSFLLIAATVLSSAMFVQALCQRYGRKIQCEKSAPPLFWQEGRDTIGTIYMVACFAAWPVTRYRAGLPTALNWSLADTGDSLWFYLLVKLIGGVVLADCWNYWKHRALHWRMLYIFHKDHHSYHDPSCFASFAIHPFEALLTFWQVMLFSIPALNLWGPVHLLSLVLLAYMNLYLHCGYSIECVERWLPRVLLNTSRFHNVHHEVTRAHFGEILFLWDWLCGTAIDHRLDDHPVIADMFEKAPYAAERRLMRRRMDERRGFSLGNTTITTAADADPV